MKFKLFLALLAFASATSLTLHSQDAEPPMVSTVTPPPGSLYDLTNIIVQFSEPVIGVGANDLLINGVAATSVRTNANTNTFTFSFPRPNITGGNVQVAWATVHGIRDLAMNPFDGANVSWAYYLIDVTPPVVREFQPAPGSTVKPLREVRVFFSEAVTNVDARDLLMNGKPAQSVTAESGPVYRFQFNSARPGKPQLAWANGHGITDLGLTPNPFAGAGLIGSYFVDVKPYSILVNATDNVARVIFSNRFFNGVCTIESREGTRWVPVKNFFATQRVGQVTVKLPANNYAQLRLRSLEVEGKKGNAFTHLAQAYGNLSTIAGGAPRPPGTNTWLTEWEGTDATNVYLSDPCCAVADEAGNIYVAERTGHAVDKITPDGRIQTFVGQHRAGFVQTNDFANATGTNTLLDRPSALFVISNRLFVLDVGNDRLRRVDLASSRTATEFTDAGLHTNLTAAGLWVGIENAGTVNEGLEVFYGAGTELRHRENGILKVEATGFQEVGSVVVNPLGRTIVADPKDYRVFRVRGTGLKEVVAGSGFPTGPFPRRFLYGGDADEVALPGARTVAYLPIGGYFIGLDQGAQVWYVDSDDNAVPFVFGEPGLHEGDGLWFRQGGRRGPKVGNVVSVTVAPSGDIILVEGGGFVRKIEFLRHLP